MRYQLRYIRIALQFAYRLSRRNVQANRGARENTISFTHWRQIARSQPFPPPPTQSTLTHHTQTRPLKPTTPRPATALATPTTVSIPFRHGWSRMAHPSTTGAAKPCHGAPNPRPLPGQFCPIPRGLALTPRACYIDSRTQRASSAFRMHLQVL